MVDAPCPNCRYTITANTLKSARTLNPVNRANNPLEPAESPRINPKRTLRYLPCLRIMPASILRTHGAILRGILIPSQCLHPLATYLWRIQQEIRFLIVEIRLGIQIPAPLNSNLLVHSINLM